MEAATRSHMARLRLMGAGNLAVIGILALLVGFVPHPPSFQLSQSQTLFWIFVFLTVVNLVTIMPTYRSSLAGPRRVYAVSERPGPLLAAHFVAHTVAFLRLEAIAVAGIVLFGVSGRQDWFAAFAAVATTGMLLLWPRRRKVERLVGRDAAHSESAAAPPPPS